LSDENEITPLFFCKRGRGSVGWRYRDEADLDNPAIITPAIKHINCHAGLDPASRLILDSRVRGNDALSCIVADVISS